jgi:hypothetical protein
MVAALSIRDDRDLVQKIFSRYLHNDRKYDAWGAQGKLLVLREILAEEGFDIQQLVRIGVQFQKLVNLVFPRTFFSHHKTENLPDITQDVNEYYREVKFQLSLQGMEELLLESIAIEETSSKYGIDTGQVKEILESEYSD